MRLVPRHRKRQRTAIEGVPRIAISQADIDADLEYRGDERRLGEVQAAPPRGRR